MITVLRRFFNKARMPDRTPDWWLPLWYRPEEKCLGLHDLEDILKHESSILVWFEEMKIYENRTGKLETLYNSGNSKQVQWLFEKEWCEILSSKSIIRLEVSDTSPFLGKLCLAYKKWSEKKVEEILLT